MRVEKNMGRGMRSVACSGLEEDVRNSLTVIVGENVEELVSVAVIVMV